MNAAATEGPRDMPRVSLSINFYWVVWLLLFLAIFAGFQGGRYYLANRLQEVGIASALLLYAFGVWRGL